MTDEDSIEIALESAVVKKYTYKEITIERKISELSLEDIDESDLGKMYHRWCDLKNQSSNVRKLLWISFFVILFIKFNSDISLNFAGFKIEASSGFLPYVLFIYSCFLILNSVYKVQVNVMKGVIERVIEEKFSSDEASLRKFCTFGDMRWFLWPEFSDLMAAKKDKGAHLAGIRLGGSSVIMGVKYMFFTVIYLSILLFYSATAFFVYIAIPISAAYDVFGIEELHFVSGSFVFYFTIIAVASYIIILSAYDTVKFRFYDPAIIHEYRENQKKYGEEAALKMLRDRLLRTE